MLSRPSGCPSLKVGTKREFQWPVRVVSTQALCAVSVTEHGRWRLLLEIFPWSVCFSWQTNIHDAPSQLTVTLRACVCLARPVSLCSYGAGEYFVGVISRDIPSRFALRVSAASPADEVSTHMRTATAIVDNLAIMSSMDPHVRRGSLMPPSPLSRYPPPHRLAETPTHGW